MRVVIAPDSFKECLPAVAVCHAIAVGVRRAAPDATIVELPMADGGEGTVEAMVHATGGRFCHANVTDPLGNPVNARFGALPDGVTAVIEMAAASGLELVPLDRRNPLVTTTYGTGELLRAALDAGATRLIVGIGGSATNDGGAGAAQALGYRLVDAAGESIPRGGGGLERLARIESQSRDPRLANAQIDVACDVNNPLTGPTGASAIFGPQKGATAETVARLDRNLGHLAAIVRRDLHVEIETLPGSGAAGGLGGGLVAFAGATLRRGVELVVDSTRLREKLAGADLCLTGEGAVDHTNNFGKTAVGVASVAAALGVPVVVLTGAKLDGASGLLHRGVTACLAIAPGPITRDIAIASAAELLADAAEQVVRIFMARDAR